MIISSIDIGTNTVLMATVEVDPGRPARVIGDEHTIVRLGQGVDASRLVGSEAVQRVCECLRRYVKLSRTLNADRLVCVATSALRDAQNRTEAVGQIWRETGISIRILSGQDEAELTFSGALFGMKVPDGVCGVIDIGGGSTELAIGSKEVGVSHVTSLDVGAVRLTERFLQNAPPAANDIERARAWTLSMTEGLEPLAPEIPLVGVAGTITTIGALVAHLPRFDAHELDGYTLHADEVSGWSDRLAMMTLEEIRQLRPVHPDRADVLLGGVLALEAMLSRLDVDRLVVSTRGLRYGVALREAMRDTNG